MKKRYRISEFAKLVGCSASTVRRWDAIGWLPAKRSPSGHRYYDDDDVQKVVGTSTESPAASLPPTEAAETPSPAPSELTKPFFCCAFLLIDQQSMENFVKTAGQN